MSVFGYVAYLVGYALNPHVIMSYGEVTRLVLPRLRHVQVGCKTTFFVGICLHSSFTVYSPRGNKIYITGGISVFL